MYSYFCLFVLTESFLTNRNSALSINDFILTFSKIKRAMGDLSEVWFNAFTPLNTPRKQAARAFYHLMGKNKPLVRFSHM
jgi:hypothetical protein